MYLHLDNSAGDDYDNRSTRLHYGDKYENWYDVATTSISFPHLGRTNFLVLDRFEYVVGYQRIDQ